MQVLHSCIDGRAPVITDGLGKISIVGIMDPSGPMVINRDPSYSNAEKTRTFDAAEYIRLRFKAVFEFDNLTEEERDNYKVFLAQLDDFPRPTAENLA